MRPRVCQSFAKKLYHVVSHSELVLEVSYPPLETQNTLLGLSKIFWEGSRFRLFLRFASLVVTVICATVATSAVMAMGQSPGVQSASFQVVEHEIATRHPLVHYALAFRRQRRPHSGYTGGEYSLNGHRLPFSPSLARPVR